MYIVLSVRRLLGAVTFLFAVTGFACVVSAQAPEHQHDAQTTAPEEHAGQEMVEMAREGSGTAWLPD